MIDPNAERHALPLTLDQLTLVQEILEASPRVYQPEVSKVLGQVQKLRKQVLADRARMANCKHEFIEFTYGPYCHKCRMPEPVDLNSLS
ncbi:hypothetical protein [Pseudomonas serbica]|uniref:hypothetical protein n=1 Tax=Pseudomonas serbica TaxID=2965074 RepID=UPI00237B8803|nr:hypothetical protein [Pseudomonas serbica]